MALAERPATSRVDEAVWTQKLRRYEGIVDDAYVFLREPSINPRDPEGTLLDLFGAAVHAEAQIAQVVTTALGRGVTELVAVGHQLEKLVEIKLPEDYSDMLAVRAVEVHDLFGGPDIPPPALAQSLRETVFPKAGLGAVVNAIASLEDGQIPPHEHGIIDLSRLSGPPPDRLPVAQRFLAGGPQNVEIARRAFEVSLTTLLDHREERNAYHVGLVAPEVAGLPSRARREAYLDIRAGFGGPMIDKMAAALTPQSVPGARLDQLNAFANNIVAYAKF